MQCKNCGANIQEGATFCMNCGAACEAVTQVPQTPVQPMQQPTMMLGQPTGMQPNNNQNSNKKMYIIIGGIIVVAVVAIVVVLLLDNKKESSTSTSNSNTQSNSNSVSNSNSNILEDDDDDDYYYDYDYDYDYDDDDDTVTVSGGEIEFNGYTFTIPTNYVAEVEHWDYVGDIMTITMQNSTYPEFEIEVENTPYEDFKAEPLALKREVSSNGYYTVGEIEYRTYNGKEYLIVSRSVEDYGLTHMFAYVALSDTETLIIDGVNSDYEEDYELFSEISSIIASAHK